MKVISNLALFQLGWFACVVGAAGGRPYVGPAVVAVALALHVRLAGTRREGVLILASAILGGLAESAFGLTGLVSYRADPPPAWLCPPWIVALWANFGLTLRHSLRWLERRPGLAAALGAAFGPLAYAAGARLGAMTFHDAAVGILFLSVLWALSLPALLRLSKYLA